MEDWEIVNKIVEILREKGGCIRSMKELEDELYKKGVEVSYPRLKRILNELEANGHVVIIEKGRRKEICLPVEEIEEELPEDVKKHFEDFKKFLLKEYSKKKRKIILAATIYALLIILLFIYDFWYGLFFLLGNISLLLKSVLLRKTIIEYYEYRSLKDKDVRELARVLISSLSLGLIQEIVNALERDNKRKL